MFLPKNTFRNFVKSSKEPKKVINCNDCKYQKSCIENKYIMLVTYPTGEKGYAKTIVHHFSNTCNFPIDEY